LSFSIVPHSAAKRTERAGDHLHVDASGDEHWNQGLDFAVSNQRIAAHQRQMQRLEPVHHLEHTVNQSLAFSVVQAPQRDIAAEVLVVVRVATGTAKRTFLGNFNG
jgi:hypothetical protein